MLELVNVTKHFHGIPAVRSLNLTVRPGQVLGVLGANGSGKSTTVRMIVGLLHPSRGTIRWQGADIQSQRIAYQRVVGYVPEEPRLYGYLTAIEYLELVGGLRHIPARTLRRRIERYLDLFELEHTTHTALSAFSKGMRQKVLLSAALLHDPALLVLDEPNSGLDVAASLVLRSLVATLASQGKAIVYSSHVLDAVEKACDDVVILRKSHVVACNSVSRLCQMSHDGTLEAAFASVTVDQDVTAIAAELAQVSHE